MMYTPYTHGSIERVASSSSSSSNLGRRCRTDGYRAAPTSESLQNEGKLDATRARTKTSMCRRRQWLFLCASCFSFWFLRLARTFCEFSTFDVWRMGALSATRGCQRGCYEGMCKALQGELSFVCVWHIAISCFLRFLWILIPNGYCAINIVYMGLFICYGISKPLFATTV